MRARRDLKPDNILLDAMGHAHITDFNVAIHYSERRLHTSVAGSMAYMAPEVIGRLGYSWQCDWWSLGVVAWELLFHRRPFDGRTADKMKHSILKDSIRFPSSAKEKCSKDGQQFLLGVRLVLGLVETIRLLTQHPNYSSSIGIRRLVSGAEIRTLGSRTYGSIRGSRRLTGTPWRTKRRSRRSYQMYVR